MIEKPEGMSVKHLHLYIRGKADWPKCKKCEKLMDYIGFDEYVCKECKTGCWGIY
jgi:hypothetical protein